MSVAVGALLLIPRVFSRSYTHPAQAMVSADPSTRVLTYDVLNSVDSRTASIRVGWLSSAIFSG